MPQRDGRVLLDFVDGERRLLDEATATALGLDRTVMYADADTLTAAGWKSSSGERIDSTGLRAASTTAPSHHPPSRLVLGSLRQVGGPGRPPRTVDAFLDPLARDLALRIDEVFGAGMAADGYTIELGLDALAIREDARALLLEIGATWLVDAALASDDEGERMRAVLRAAWQAGVEGLGREAVEPPPRPEDVVRLDPAIFGIAAPLDSSEGRGHGWWAPPGGRALWFETSTLDIDALGADIATVAMAMHANRAADGVPEAQHLLLLPFASNQKLRMIWFDPETMESLDADEYTLVLHVPEARAETFDADDFEQLCLDGGLSATSDCTGPILHFRWEFGGEPRRLTW